MEMKKINSGKLRAIGYDARARLPGRIRWMNCSGRNDWDAAQLIYANPINLIVHKKTTWLSR